MLGDILGGSLMGGGTAAALGYAGPWGWAAGAGLGLLQGMEKQAKEKKQLELAARTQELSPWTGLQAQAPQMEGQVKPLLEGAAVGAQMYQGGQAAKNQQQLLDLYKTGYTPESVNAIGKQAQAQQNPWGLMYNQRMS